MKESKCGKIPPCYGSLEFAIYEEAKKVNDEWKKSRALHGKIIDKLRSKLMEGGFLDDTHDKVYELNKQMCDLGKTMNDPIKPLSEEAIQEITKALEITRKPKDIMKENKTKKMTKAEAFEWLKRKKVRFCDRETSEKVQLKLFACGIKWRCGESAYYNFGSFLFIDNEGFLSHCGDDEEYWKRHAFEEISADIILSIEIVEEKKKTEEEEALDRINCLGAQIVDILLHMKGHHHVTITETTVALHDEGMCLFHSDPF